VDECRRRLIVLDDEDHPAHTPFLPPALHLATCCVVEGLCAGASSSVGDDVQTGVTKTVYIYDIIVRIVVGV
jgi:hypothetical protein